MHSYADIHFPELFTKGLPSFLENIVKRLQNFMPSNSRILKYFQNHPPKKKKKKKDHGFRLLLPQW